MYRKRNPKLANLMFDKEWSYNDTIWEGYKFKRLTRNISKTVYVVDLEPREVRLIYEITFLKNLSPEQLQDFQYTFNYIYRVSRRIWFHNIIGLGFLNMAPAFFGEQQQQARDLRLPLLGIDYEMD